VGFRARSHLSRLRRCSKFKTIKLHRRCPNRKSSQAGENTADCCWTVGRAIIWLRCSTRPPRRKRMTSMMTVWGPACAIVGFLSVGGATETRAAYWNYACKGTIGKATLLFDRSYLLIMPTKLAQGGVLGIRDGSIATFESADANSGLAPTMVFSRGDQKVTMVEASSKQTSDDAWSAAHDRRFWNRTTSIKRYRYENDNFGFGEIIERGESYANRGDIRMECIDYTARL
jgi:hypothetical protein